MNKRTALYLLLSSLFLALTLVAACTTNGETESTPISLPTDAPPQEPKTLTAAELMAVNEFAAQQEAIGVEWDNFHTDFDAWRTTLSDCDDSDVQAALRGFIAGSGSVTQEARDLPRASVTRELAETLIEAAESEEEAFRQLHERWQPNSPSLFDEVEQRRTESARAQRTVQDLMDDSREELEEAADPERLQALEEFATDLDAISDDWDDLHDDYARLLRETDSLDDLAVLARLDKLFEKLDSIAEWIDGMPSSDATEDLIDALEEAAEDEQDALANLHGEVLRAISQKPETGNMPVSIATPEGVPTPTPAPTPLDTIAPLHEELEASVKESRAVLKEVDNTVDEALDGSAEEDLEDLQEFAAMLEAFLPAWDGFHEQYSKWRASEGGCNTASVRQDLDEFNLRMTEISRQVRDLPQAGYLLPMYSLLVEAAEREEGAMRALRNTWQPFTVDAFIAAERERDNGDRLRREAGIALEELRNRS